MRESRGDVSSIPDPVLRRLEARLSGVQARIPLDEGARTVRLANGQVVTVTHKTVALQITVHRPLGTVVLDLDLYAVIPYSYSVFIVGRVILDKLGLNLNSQMSQLPRARPAGPASGVETPSYISIRWVALSKSLFSNARKVEQEQDKAVEQLPSRRPEISMATEDPLRACTEALDRGVKEATANSLPPE